MLNCQRNLFSIPDSIHYLNCAYMSPQLKTVEDIGHSSLKRKNSPWEMEIMDFFEPVEKLKSLFARLVNAKDANRIAIIPSASYGLSTVARNLPLRAGQEIIVVEGQFPSNVYPWKREADAKGAHLKIISAPKGDNRGENWNTKILEAINENTAAVALGNIHWADGTKFDLLEIRKITNQYGAWLVIDGTQSVGALPIDVEELKPEALVCGGYKWLLGPYSLGMAYFSPVLDHGIPLEENWINRYGSEDFSTLVNYQENYQSGASRYSVGEHSNFQLVPMLTKAIEQLIAWDPKEIQNYCYRLNAPYLDELKSMGIFIENEKWRASHLFGLHLPDYMLNKPIQSLLQQNNVFISRRGNAFRISPHLYNSAADMEALVFCFQQVQ
jgi:selenocysteine lyase/cysteine desulfurase